MANINLMFWILLYLYSNKSIVIAADESVVSWGPSPCFGELVSATICIPLLFYQDFLFHLFINICFCTWTVFSEFTYLRQFLTVISLLGNKIALSVQWFHFVNFCQECAFFFSFFFNQNFHTWFYNLPPKTCKEKKICICTIFHFSMESKRGATMAFKPTCPNRVRKPEELHVLSLSVSSSDIKPVHKSKI